MPSDLKSFWKKKLGNTSPVSSQISTIVVAENRDFLNF
jgi:hypothetical protein